MAKANRIPLLRFNGGEVSPAVAVRGDLEQFSKSTALSLNTIVEPEGGLSNRPGWELVDECKDLTASELFTFKYNQDQEYVLEFGAGYVWIYQDEALLYDPTANIASHGASNGSNKENPVRVSTYKNGAFDDGDTVWIEGNEMTEINNRRFEITTTPAGFAGIVSAVQLANPCVIDMGAAHGFTDGAKVWLQSFTGTTELNLRSFYVKSVSANTFALYTDRTLMTGEDARLYTAYTGLGEVFTFDIRLVGENGTGYPVDGASGTVKRVTELATPYTLGDLTGLELEYDQSGDVFYVVAPGHRERQIIRDEGGVWRIEDATYGATVGPPRQMDVGGFGTAGDGTGINDVIHQYAVSVTGWDGSESTALKGPATPMRAPGLLDPADPRGQNYYAIHPEIYEAGKVDLTALPSLLPTAATQCTVRIADNAAPFRQDGEDIYFWGGDNDIGDRLNGKTLRIRNLVPDASPRNYVDVDLYEVDDDGVEQPVNTFGMSLSTTMFCSNSVYAPTMPYPYWDQFDDRGSLMGRGKDVQFVTIYRKAGPYWYWTQNMPWGKLVDILYTDLFDGSDGTPIAYRDDDGIAPDLTQVPYFEERELFERSSEYPACISLYQQRKWLGGTNRAPHILHASHSADFPNFNLPIVLKASDPIQVPVGAQHPSALRHLVEVAGRLVVMNGGGLYVIFGGNEPITPSNAQPLSQDVQGASKAIPIVIGGAVYYVSDAGDEILAAAFSDAAARMIPVPKTITASHLFGEGKQITKLAYAHTPHRVMLARRDDGIMLSLTEMPEHEVSAWSRYDTQGTFVTATATREDGEDAFYAIVERDMNGTTKRFVERMGPRRFAQIEDATFLDSSVRIDQTPIADWTSTQDNPVVVTSTAHGLIDGDIIDISGAEYLYKAAGDVVGNWLRHPIVGQHKVANSTANTFELNDPSEDDPVDGSAWPAIGRNAVYRKCITAVTDKSGLHLAGMECGLFMNGAVEESFIMPADGNFTLPEKTPGVPKSASRICVGLKYDTRIQLLPFDGLDRSVTGRKLRVPKAMALVERSREFQVGQIGLNRWDQAKLRDAEPFNVPTDLHTGVVEFEMHGTWERRNSLEIRQTEPLPFTLLALLPEVSFGG